MAICGPLQAGLGKSGRYLESNVLHQPVNGVPGVAEQVYVVSGVADSDFTDLTGSGLGNKAVEVGLDLWSEGVLLDGLVESLLLNLPLPELHLLEVPHCLDLLELSLMNLVDFRLVLLDQVCRTLFLQFLSFSLLLFFLLSQLLSLLLELSGYSLALFSPHPGHVFLLGLFSSLSPPFVLLDLLDDPHLLFMFAALLIELRVLALLLGLDAEQLELLHEPTPRLLHLLLDQPHRPILQLPLVTLPVTVQSFGLASKETTMLQVGVKKVQV